MHKEPFAFSAIRRSFSTILSIIAATLPLEIHGQLESIRQSRYPDLKFQDFQHPSPPLHSLQYAQITGNFTLCVSDFKGIGELATHEDSIKAKWRELNVTPVFFATSHNPEIAKSKLTTLAGILDASSIKSLNIAPPLKTGDVEVILYNYRLLVARKRVQIGRFPDAVAELNQLEIEQITKAGNQAASPTSQNASITMVDSIESAVEEASRKGFPVLLVTAARTECAPYPNLKSVFEATVNKHPTLAAWLNLHTVCVLMENATPLGDRDGRVIPANLQICNRFNAKYLRPYDIHVTSPTCVFLDSSDGTALTSPIPLDHVPDLMRVAQIIGNK